MTTWKRINEFEKYEVNEMGEVRNSETLQLLKGYTTKFGTEHVVLSNNGKQTSIMRAKIVLEAFEGMPKWAHRIVYKNGDKSNCALSNLEWFEPEEKEAGTEWREIPNYSRYEVSVCGRLRNRVTGRELNPYVTIKGYERVEIVRDDKKRCMHFVHRLVAESFVNGYTLIDRFVNHKDGNKLNNAAYNLEWVSHSENIKHAIRTGLFTVDSTPRPVYVNSVLFSSIRQAAEHIGISYAYLYEKLQQNDGACVIRSKEVRFA